MHPLSVAFAHFMSQPHSIDADAVVVNHTFKVKKKSGKSVSVENGVLAINTENESDILIF